MINNGPCACGNRLPLLFINAFGVSVLSIVPACCVSAENVTKGGWDFEYATLKKTSTVARYAVSRLMSVMVLIAYLQMLNYDNGIVCLYRDEPVEFAAVY